MSSTRFLSWSSALADIRRDRSLDVEARRAHCRREAFSTAAYQSICRDRSARILVVAGRYDRKAIMAAAVRIAKARQSVTGDAWAECMASALRGVWKAAKAARPYSSH